MRGGSFQVSTKICIILISALFLNRFIGSDLFYNQIILYGSDYLNKKEFERKKCAMLGEINTIMDITLHGEFLSVSKNILFHPGIVHIRVNNPNKTL